MDHQHIPRHSTGVQFHWEVPGLKRGPGRLGTNWRSSQQGWESPRRKQRWQLKTDQNGVGVWPGCGLNQGQGENTKNTTTPILTF